MGEKKWNRVVNMTPHDVIVVSDRGEVIRKIPASGRIVRLACTCERIGVVEDSIPLSFTVYSEPSGLPPRVEGTLLIVSQIVKNGVRGRDDLVVPTELVRDTLNNIIGCRSLGV